MEFTGILKDYSGQSIPSKLKPHAKEMYEACLNYMHAAFGDNVEYERLIYDQVLLCPETRAALYEPPTPVKYKRGMRPVLDKVVDEATEGVATETEKAIAIMAYIRDLKEKSGWHDYFYGGTEEELIKKGERYCERVARLMTALCEVAGIPARIVFHIIGHLTCEAYVDGKWAYFDPRFGLFYIDSEGKPLSVAEIADNPEVILNQPEWVYAYGSREYTHEFMAQSNYLNYLHPNQLQVFGYYTLTDSDKFHYEWMPAGNIKVPARDAIHDVYVEKINKFMEIEGLRSPK